MLKSNTVNKLKTIILAGFILFSVSLFAQSEKTSEKSTIVMTKSELNSFLSTIAEARRSQLKERENRRVKQDLAALRLKYQQRSGTEAANYGEISNQQLLNELRYLNRRIDNLNVNGNSYPSGNRDNSTIIMPSNSNPNPFYPPNNRSTTTVVPSNSSKIIELENIIDSLRNVKAIAVPDKNVIGIADSLRSVNSKLTNVRRQLDSLELKMKAAKKVVKRDKSVTEKSYFKQQVYFDNNSEKLGAEYFKYIQDLTQILMKYPDSKVMLEGWASSLGSSKYNKQISMRRAEAVENAFINNRIDKSRIITSFRGEDQSSSAQHGRRVDMSIIVR